MTDEKDTDIRIHYNEEPHNNAKIKVIGVGGGGGNAVNRMISAGVEGVAHVRPGPDGASQHGHGHGGQRAPRSRAAPGHRLFGGGNRDVRRPCRTRTGSATTSGIHRCVKFDFHAFNKLSVSCIDRVRAMWVVKQPTIVESIGGRIDHERARR